MLDAYWSTAAPLITRRYRGEVEKFIGDGIVATFNSRGDQPDHATRAARRRARAAERIRADPARLIPTWPLMRIGVNSGEVVVRGGRRRRPRRLPAASATPSTRARGSKASPPPAAC